MSSSHSPHSRDPAAQRSRVSDEVDEELAFHLAMRTRDYEAQGLDRSAAGLVARRRFGNVQGIRRQLIAHDEARERRRVRRERLEQFGQEAQRALHALRRTPAFFGVVAGLLALGIGLASATGVIARAIAFAGLPVRDADRVVVLWGSDRTGSFPRLPLAPTELPGLAAAMRGTATVAAGDYNGANPWPFVPPGGAADERGPLLLRGTLAGGTYFEVLGVRPVLGRALRPEDDVIGAPRVMVLSHAAWRRHFGGDPAVVGRALHSVTWGVPYTVVGVMPPGLDVPRGVEFWTAFAPTAARNGSLAGSWFNVHVVARLAPGATPERARDVLTAYYAVLAAQGQDRMLGARATVRTLPELVSGDVRPAFRALVAAATVVLLATCATAAGLLLLRAARRRRDLSGDAGAAEDTRTRPVRALLAEHAVLVLSGGAFGLATAALAVQGFATLAPPELPRVADLRLDTSLLAVVAAVTVGVVLLVGVVPAIVGARVAPAAARGGARTGAGRSRRALRAPRLLVGAQVALALVVLAAASLVGRDLARLTALDLGLVAPDRLAFVELIPASGVAEPSDGAPAAADAPSRRARWVARQEAVMARVRAAPGVVAVAPVVHEPYAGSAGWDGRVAPEGGAPQDAARRPYLNMEVTNADYLRATGTALLRGRWLAESDREDTPRVVVLSAQAARALFPAGDAVGRRVVLWGGTRATVAGIVADTRFREFLAPRATVYLPYGQFDAAARFLAVRTTGDAAGVPALVRRAAAGVAPGLLVQGHGTLRARLAEPLARPRLLAGVLVAYAVVVVVLAVAGLGAVVAGAAAAERRAVGVRAVRGTTRHTLAVRALREGLAVAAAGAGVGLLAAVASRPLATAVLSGGAPADSTTLAVAALALLGVCAAAALVSAVRAEHGEPAGGLSTR